jgi:hypothetical protein
VENMNNMDLQNCGNNSKWGLMLNYNDTSGTPEGKKMLYMTLMAAKMTNEKINICSSGCDSQHSAYSRISYINNY